MREGTAELRSEADQTGEPFLCYPETMKITRLDHVGINVENLAAAKEFFLALGLQVLGEMDVQGEWVERIIGLTDVRDTIVMMGIPGGGANIELVQFHSPKDAQGVQPQTNGSTEYSSHGCTPCTLQRRRKKWTHESEIRYMGTLIDELAKGRAMEKILRSSEF